MTSFIVICILAFCGFVLATFFYVAHVYLKTSREVNSRLNLMPKNDADFLRSWEDRGMITLFPAGKEKLLVKVYLKLTGDEERQIYDLAQSTKMLKIVS